MTNSRRKGINGELEAAKLWLGWFPKCRRSFGQARQGYEQPDIIGGGIERCFYVEVKRIKNPPTKGQVQKWIAKQVDDWRKFVEMAGYEPKPILMFRADHQREWTVMFMGGRIPWSDWERVLDRKLGNCR